MTLETPPFDIHAWRRRFPLLEQSIHVSNCSQSPQSDATRQAARDYLDNWNTEGRDWDRWIEEIHLAKAEFARLIGAEPDDIAVGSSVSEITSALAGALSFQGKRTKVAVTEAEFPTVGHVWLAQQKFGADVQFVPVRDGIIDPAEYDRVVDEETLIASICDVYYYNGFKQDLADIIPRIHAKGSLVYVDAYQGLGTHPLDVRKLDIDFLASGNLKYLLGTPGIAFLYVKPDLVDMLHPAFTGWFGQENPFSFDIHRLDFARTARRLEGGTPPILPAYIARAGMRLNTTVDRHTLRAMHHRCRCAKSVDRQPPRCTDEGAQHRHPRSR